MKTLLSTITLGAAVTLSAADKPNIIFILADDLGWGEVGFNGQSKIKTPHIDSIASNGAVMTDFYAACPVCGPSRAGLMTGRHLGTCKIRGNPKWTKGGKAIDLDDTDMTVAKELKRAGYATAVFGKWGLNENLSNPETGDGTGHPLKQGFDEFWGFNTHVEAHYHWPDYVWNDYKKVDLGGASNWENKKVYADDLFTDKALDFIDRKGGEQPLFIYLAYTIPHKGYSAPESSRTPYESLGWPKKNGKVKHYRDDPEVNTAYAGMITHMDSGIGKVLEKLNEKGILENTLVVFTSDNGHEYDGEFFKSNGIYSGKKRMVTDGGIRMPTAVSWPGTVKPGTKIKESLAFWDILATFCDLAGIDPSQGHDGISFVPSLKGDADSQKKHDYLYWEFNEKAGPMQALRFDNWKALRYWDKKANKMGAIKLFDIVKDSKEKKNLASSMPEVAQRAEKYFLEARTEHPNFPLEPLKTSKKKGKKGKK